MKKLLISLMVVSALNAKVEVVGDELYELQTIFVVANKDFNSKNIAKCELEIKEWLLSYRVGNNDYKYIDNIVNCLHK